MEPNTKHRPSRAIVLALSSGLVSATAAHAEGPDGGGGTEVILTGYLYASALDGSASSAPGLPAANIDLSFRDILDDLDFGFMSALELRLGRCWALLHNSVCRGFTS